MSRVAKLADDEDEVAPISPGACVSATELSLKTYSVSLAIQPRSPRARRGSSPPSSSRPGGSTAALRLAPHTAPGRASLCSRAAATLSLQAATGLALARLVLVHLASPQFAGALARSASSARSCLARSCSSAASSLGAAVERTPPSRTHAPRFVAPVLPSSPWPRSLTRPFALAALLFGSPSTVRDLLDTSRRTRTPPKHA